MTYAYGESYLDDAMNNLGEAVDYAVHACNVSADDFMSMFVTSGYAKQFESGVAKVVSGLSGSELVLSVLRASGKQIDAPAARLEYDCSPEYWCGYILAYYQWHSAISFKDILKAIPTGCSFFVIILAIFNDAELSLRRCFFTVSYGSGCVVENEVGVVLVELIKFCVLKIHYCNSFQFAFSFITAVQFWVVEQTWNYGYLAM